MADPHTNFGYSTVATAPSPASSGTSLVVQAGDGAKFPSTGSFNATVWPASTQPTTANAEIVRVTAISTDTFTITRAQESTSARTIVIGDQIADTITAKTLTDLELGVYLTTSDKTIPATTQVIFETYLELAASFFYELSTDAILVIGDFATPLPAPDQNTNIFVTVNDETVPPNSEIIFSDFYELSAPFVSEVATTGLLQLGTVSDPGTGIGQMSLVYRYTVASADKVAIDTGVDTPDAGSNNWTNCDLLEIVLNSRTDESAIGSNVAITLNNDTGSVYDYQAGRVVGTANAYYSSVAQASFLIVSTGALVANTSVFGTADLKIPNPTGSVANKTISGTYGFGDPGDSTNQVSAATGGVYRPLTPTALTRLKITPATGGAKLKVGTQVLIYKRMAS